MVRSLVSDIRNLQRRNSRRRRPRAVLEGVRLVEEALRAAIPMHGAVVSASLARTTRGSALRRTLDSHGVTIEEVSEDTLLELADTVTPQGVLAVVEPPVWTLQEIAVGVGAGAPVMVLDGLADPGNVGTAIRTAFGLGAAGVVLLPGTARATHPKVLRASMGSTFHFPVVASSDEAFQGWVEERGVTLWVAEPGGVNVAALNPPERLAIIVGSEAHGVRPALRQRAAERVAIPIVRGADSLNAAVAAGILLHEVVREP
jgi:RNA methyltransferase, TrmH family